jgi:hypothetical protein
MAISELTAVPTMNGKTPKFSRFGTHEELPRKPKPNF